jgi:DNA-binding NarL/FixJ family response regulator
VKTLLADGCPIVLRGLKGLLASLRGAEVVGEAMNEEETLRLAARLRPDVVFLDPGFGVEAPVPLRHGEVPEIDILRELKALPGPPCVIVYAASNSTADLMSLVLAGVDGYVHKSTPPGQLARDMGSALAGRPPWRLGLSPEEAHRRLMTASRVYRLSRMEGEVLGLVLNNRTDKQMARRLRISPHTVKKHVGSMLKKLEYGSRKDICRD